MFLGLVTVVCILLFSTRMLWSFTSLFSDDGTSKLVNFAIVSGESARLGNLFTEERLKENETILRVAPTPDDGEDEVIEFPRQDLDDVDGTKSRLDEEPEEEASEEGKRKMSDAIAYLEQLSEDLKKSGQ